MIELAGLLANKEAQLTEQYTEDVGVQPLAHSGIFRLCRGLALGRNRLLGRLARPGEPRHLARVARGLPRRHCLQLSARMAFLSDPQRKLTLYMSAQSRRAAGQRRAAHDAQGACEARRQNDIEMH